MISYYTVETYAVFKNLDKSILKANDFLYKYGYQFVVVDLHELEKNFSGLFSLPKNFQPETVLTFGDSDITISNEFHKAFLNSSIFGLNSFFLREIILLKRINDYEQKVINKGVDNGGALQIMGELQEFTKQLVQQLRLFKNGDIFCPVLFQITKQDRHITGKYSVGGRQVTSLMAYSLSAEEAIRFFGLFRESLQTNSLTELALSNFNLSYEIEDIKTKYITLMTCLESIFNQGRDQITHTVSRHLALITSKSEQEFQINYRRIKHLYKVRSMIVHGGKVKDDLNSLTSELQNNVRSAINYCLASPHDKETLFDKLNAMGFERPNAS